LRIKSNTKIKAKQLEKYAQKLAATHGSGILRQAMFAGLELIGNVTVQDYFKATQVSEIGSPSGTRLRIRSGRLAGSYLSTWRFSKSTLPIGVKNVVPSKFTSSSEDFDEGKKESIREVTVSGKGFKGRIGSKVEYAAIQEKGGTTHPKVTEKSRRFFWAMYFKTGEDMWKGLALTTKTTLDITIPARPALVPAAKKSMPDVEKIFKEAIKGSFEKEKI